METRKVRTPSARLLASKQDEVFDKVIVAAGAPLPQKQTLLNTLAGQLAYVKKVGESSGLTDPMPIPHSSQSTSSSHQLTQLVRQLTSHSTPQHQNPRHQITSRDTSMEKEEEEDEEEGPPMEDEIDVSNNEMDGENEMGGPMEMQMKQEKMDAQMLMNGDFSVASEVTISSMKYQGRPTPARNLKVSNTDDDDHQHRIITSTITTTTTTTTIPQELQPRVSNFTGETLNLKSSDLSIPNKAAHFLYFRCYEEHEVQKEFPLTIDENRKGPQNFLVEPRVGLKNTDYYIDSYLWNRGKSTSSKKKIFVEIEGNHVKTSRRSCDTAHYVLNWYYSNMENRICKKVCWLETVSDGVRASPVLVQYHVNYLSDNPIELRKTPKLYSDTRSVAQELLRSDSPLQTVQRFVETGETDPREIINKKQAYEMRRYVMANARKRGLRKFDDMYFDDEMYEEIFYNEHGEPIPLRNNNNNRGGGGGEQQTEASRAAQMAIRMEGRRIEHRIARILDSRLPAPKNHAEMVSEWIQTLEGTTTEDFPLVIHDVIGSMRRQLNELLGESSQHHHHHHHPDYLDEMAGIGGGGGPGGVGEGEGSGIQGGPSTSTPTPSKRMKMMHEEGEEEENLDEHHHVHQHLDEEDEVEVEHNRMVAARRRAQQKQRFEERFIFEGQEYVEEEVVIEEVTEEIEEVVEEDVATTTTVINGGDVATVAAVADAHTSSQESIDNGNEEEEEGEEGGPVEEEEEQLVFFRETVEPTEDHHHHEEEIAETSDVVGDQEEEQ